MNKKVLLSAIEFFVKKTTIRNVADEAEYKYYKALLEQYLERSKK